MSDSLEPFAARVSEFIMASLEGCRRGDPKTPGSVGRSTSDCLNFDDLALRLFRLQYGRNPAYRTYCDGLQTTPSSVRDWRDVPAIPAAGFKDLELSCLAPAERTAEFHSSGTTEQRPSRHFHNRNSLAVYEHALWAWFHVHLLPSPASSALDAPGAFTRPSTPDLSIFCLTPGPKQAPHSSLVHMFEVIRRGLGLDQSVFAGSTTAAEGGWGLGLELAIARLDEAVLLQRPVILLGTAFSFVHLLDGLAGRNLRFALPPGSRALETGGYKGRSRSLPRPELYGSMGTHLGLASNYIVSEYGMSELSSQAYDWTIGDHGEPEASLDRQFRFPPWVRAQVISPETGLEVATGQEGLLRIFDLANIYSVMAIQTEDRAVKMANGFRLRGRAALAEQRGCSLMAV